MWNITIYVLLTRFFVYYCFLSYRSILYSYLTKVNKTSYLKKNSISNQKNDKNEQIKLYNNEENMMNNFGIIEKMFHFFGTIIKYISYKNTLYPQYFTKKEEVSLIRHNNIKYKL